MNSNQDKKGIELGIQHKMPPIARWYLVTKILSLIFILSIPLSLIGIPFLSVFTFLFLFIGIPLIFYLLLVYEFITFIVEENRITINYGIIVKHSTTISFENAQSVKNKRGILSQLFGISEIKVWTASTENINVRDNQKEDLSLYLLKEDADWLKEFIYQKK